MKKLLPGILLFIFFISGSVFSQSFPFRNFSSKDGLCNYSPFKIIQDKDGYIWIGTNIGLSRFDGYNFTNYYKKDGLNSNAFSGFGLTNDSVLFIANYSGGINYYKDGKFGNYEIKDFKNYQFGNILIVNDTFIVYGTNYVNIITGNTIKPLFENTTLTDISGASLSMNVQEVIYDKLSKKFVFLIGSNLYELKNNKPVKILIKNSKDISYTSLSTDNDGCIWLGSANKIYKVINYSAENIIEIPAELAGRYISKIMRDSYGNIWFYSWAGRLNCYMNGRFYDVSSKFRTDNLVVRSIYEDNQKNIWVCTQSDGVYLIYNTFLKNYGIDDGISSSKVNAICPLDGEGCLIGTYNGLNLFRDEKFERIKVIKSDNQFDNVLETKRGKDGSYVISMGVKENLNSVIPLIYKNLPLYILPGVSGYMENPSYIISGERDNMMTFYNLEKSRFSYDTMYIKSNAPVRADMVWQIEKDGDSKFIVGTINGLYIIKGKEKKSFIDNDVLSKQIIKIIPLRNGMFVVSSVKGIALLKNGDVVFTQTEGDFFDFASVRDLTIDGNNNLWIGGRGLYEIPLDSFLNNNLGSLRKYDASIGIPLVPVSSLQYNRSVNCLYVGSQNGFSVIDLNRIEDMRVPPLEIKFSKIELPDTSLYAFSDLKFEFDRNDMVIHFVSFDYGSPNSVVYEYKINDEVKWSETKVNNINFRRLSHGEYVLRVRARNAGGLRSEISEIKFEIAAPFWKTTWFYVLLVIIATGVTGFAFNKRTKHVKQKAEENLEIEKNISSLKHLALSASLNPHFIFNTLNSIQYYINEHNKEEASKYLVNFSRLIRMNLDLAGNTFIILRKELERLELYMRYEKLRFEERMEYDVKIDENIHPDKLEIPNMILQPFVENSVWHGLMNKEENGRIDINIKNNNLSIHGRTYPVVQVEIIDNGVGLESAAKHRQQNHISKGISIIRDRLKLLAPDLKDYDFIAISDRSDGIQGVIVVITLLPGQYNIIK
jgi:ligand-binding sensor domain-containing protein